MNPKVRQTLELIDPMAVREGAPSYASLEAALEAARSAGDAGRETEALLDLAVRVSSIATFLSMMARSSRALPDMPNLADALEPAVDLYERAVNLASTRNDRRQERIARNGLGNCYLQAQEFVAATKQLSRALDLCRMPDDAFLMFDTVQKIGDCHQHLEQDGNALAAYRRGLDIAIEIDDPFEIAVQLVKIATALRNLEQYDEALARFGEAREQFARLGADTELQQKVAVHKNLFAANAMSSMVADTDQRIAATREAPGRDLLRGLPDRLAVATSAAMAGRLIPDAADWPVIRSLNLAVRGAATVLGELMELPADATRADDQSDGATLRLIGALARRCVEPGVPDPASLTQAARYVMQIDRSRRAAVYLRQAEASAARPGPFGGGTSPHALYLRSFVASAHLPQVVVEPWGTLDLEELLACRFDTSPLIALGNPELERFGPGRSTTVDENWRAVLRALALEAQMILVVPAHTMGTSWEIEWVATNKFLHKSCFLMPPAVDAVARGWWEDNWRELKRWAVRFGFDLPDYTADGCAFRLTSEGRLDRTDFQMVYETGDLKMPLMHRLLFQPNVSWDFLYGIHGMMADDSSKSVAGVSMTPAERQELDAFDGADRREMADWAHDAAHVPDVPAVVMYFETPFRMLWVEEVENLNVALNSHYEGVAIPVKRALLHHLNLLERLTPQQVEQVVSRTLTIDEIVNFRVRQVVSYRFITLADSNLRGRIVDLVWSGASRHGAPPFVRPVEAATT